MALSKSYSSVARNLQAKITFSNDQDTNFFFRITEKDHTNDIVPLKELQPWPQPFLSFPYLRAQITQTHWSFYQEWTRRSQYCSKLHTWACIKLFPLTLCGFQKTNPGSECPSKAFSGLLQELSRTMTRHREKAHQVGAGRWEEKSWGPLQGHTGNCPLPVSGDLTLLFILPGLLGSLTRLCEARIWKKEDKEQIQVRKQ